MKLKYYPIKQNIINLKKSDILFYNQPKTGNYKVFSQTKGVIGDFSVEKRKEMFISRLYVSSEKRGNDYGTKILNFVKLLSQKEGLGGKMRVLASLLGNETKNPPHIFYRKYGFTCDDSNVLQKIDEHIAKKQQLPSLYKPTFMYYVPPKK